MKTMKMLLLAILMPCLAYCWNANGHQTCGAITYYYLKNHNPAVLEKVLATLRLHPWYNTEWAPKLAALSSEEKDIALFMLASTFPDDARPSAVYGGAERGKWHYVDYPYVPAGQNVKGEMPQTPNAEQKIIALTDSFKLVAGPAGQAVDLCWIFHLIEDVHMPLHAVSMYTDKLPQGDRGGNLVSVQLNAGTPVKLHYYWDALVSKDIEFNRIPSVAKDMLNDTKYKEAMLPELKEHPDVHQWIYDESYQYAITAVYQNGKIDGTAQAPKAIDDAYNTAATQLADKRVVLASIRLAKKLEEIYR